MKIKHVRARRVVGSGSLSKVEPLQEGGDLKNMYPSMYSYFVCVCKYKSIHVVQNSE